ncbi:MAG: hypothetical protein P1V81_07660 [Planctomycetota bacterium]|nr:hypothetical protein [Planctomycetota bacterium]
MHAALLALALAASTPALAPSQETPEVDQNDPVAVYHALHEAGDHAAMVAFWASNEARVLYTIDADLEGSLAMWEGARDPETGEVVLNDEAQAVIDLHHDRALFGARAAAEAFDRPIFHDYVASFISWSAEDKLAFRGGQAAFSNAITALGTGDFEAALVAGERCTSLAEPLGDWWGASMGLGASGAARLELGDAAGALADLSRARLLDQALGLSRSEKRNLDSMLRACVELGRMPRAIACCEALIALTSGDEAAAYTEQLASLQAGE